jgi:ribosomal protein S18 acetylase RimI-like enzyme
MTPPYNLWLAQPRDPDAVAFLAQELASTGVELPGVTAARPEVDELADAWERLRGVERRLRHGQGIYKASAVEPPDVPGRMRPAGEADRALLGEWWLAFVREALHEGGPDADAAAAVDRRLIGRGGSGAVVWDDGGPVCFAGFGGRTPNGIRIGPVYTPPEHRRRGYGSALTAALTRRLLDEGRDYCFLYTDLANETSNRIYRAIGYELVCESAEYAFV